jgi:hypothetical protein
MLLQSCHIVHVSMILPNVHRQGQAAVTIVFLNEIVAWGIADQIEVDQ